MLLCSNDYVQKQLIEARVFADHIGARESLEEQLELLGKLYEREGRVRECVLFSDHAPHSFFFSVCDVTPEKRTELLCGGLIYYGPHETGVGVPQFSVSMGGDAPRWEIHT